MEMADFPRCAKTVRVRGGKELRQCRNRATHGGYCRRHWDGMEPSTMSFNLAMEALVIEAEKACRMYGGGIALGGLQKALADWKEAKEWEESKKQ